MRGKGLSGFCPVLRNERGEGLGAESREKASIKCLVWDLDNTLWRGVLLEDDQIVLRDSAVRIVKSLDDRGILQSIASKNEIARAMAKLHEFDLQDYFLYPQITWNSKAVSIAKIAELINIGLDSVAFIDDDSVERAEVSFSLPQVLCIDAGELDSVLDRPEMNPRFVTEDSKNRRLLYLRDIQRQKDEEEYVGPKEEFLATLEMVFTISEAREEDLKRAEELTVRTHQLNSTGYTYSYDELHFYLHSKDHKLFVAELKDKYGSYGKIGLCLLECDGGVWTIKLLLMSCRIMSRGVGTIFINQVMKQAQEANVRLRAEFVPTDRNRIMYVTYKFAGFREHTRKGDLVIFENDLTRLQPFPGYVKVKLES